MAERMSGAGFDTREFGILAIAEAIQASFDVEVGDGFEVTTSACTWVL